VDLVHLLIKFVKTPEALDLRLLLVDRPEILSNSPDVLMIATDYTSMSV
jgi:hypothetical protein